MGIYWGFSRIWWSYHRDLVRMWWGTGDSNMILPCMVFHVRLDVVHLRPMKGMKPTVHPNILLDTKVIHVYVYIYIYCGCQWDKQPRTWVCLNIRNAPKSPLRGECDDEQVDFKWYLFTHSPMQYSRRISTQPQVLILCRVYLYYLVNIMGFPQIFTEKTRKHECRQFWLILVRIV